MYIYLLYLIYSYIATFLRESGEKKDTIPVISTSPDWHFQGLPYIIELIRFQYKEGKNYEYTDNRGCVQSVWPARPLF